MLPTASPHCLSLATLASDDCTDFPVTPISEACFPWNESKISSHTTDNMVLSLAKGSLKTHHKCSSEIGTGDAIGDYTLGPLIAYGGFSTVYKTWTHNPLGKLELVMKVVRTQNIEALLIENPFLSDTEAEAAVKENKAAIEREVRIWRMLDHPNVLPLLDVFIIDDAMFAVSRYCNEGSLQSLIAECGFGESVRARDMIRDVAHGIVYLHAKGVVHGDIKLENILVHSNNGKETAMIADFGLARLVDEDIHLCEGLQGTLSYASPQIIQSNSNYAEFSDDVWALGVCAFAIVNGYLPFSDCFVPRLLMQIVNDDVVWDREYKLAAICINGWLRKDPKVRMSIEEGLDCYWMTM